MFFYQIIKVRKPWIILCYELDIFTHLTFLIGRFLSSLLPIYSRNVRKMFINYKWFIVSKNNVIFIFISSGIKFFISITNVS